MNFFEKLINRKNNNMKYYGNSYKYALDNNIEGTDEQIVEQIKGKGITQKNIFISDLMHLLNMRGMLIHLATPKSNGSKWDGPITSMLAAIEADGNQAFISATKVWFSHITNPRSQMWETTNPEYASAFWALTQAFSSSGLFNEGDFEAIAELGGGWLFGNLTVEKYLEDKEYYITKEAEYSFRNKVDRFLRKFNKNIKIDSEDPLEVFQETWSEVFNEAQEDPDLEDPDPEDL
jgi:hypothetical protein